jgi:hypothetical protein
MSLSAPARGVAALASQEPESACEEGEWARFASVLRRLDALLAQAVEIAQLRFGEEAATDPYRGLHITPDQVERALAIAPGTPLLLRAAPPDCAEEPGEMPLLVTAMGRIGRSRPVSGLSRFGAPRSATGAR